jgi:hypothetical protein
MSNAISIPLGVIVSRETVGAPWQMYRWRPIGVLMDAPPAPVWREIHREKGIIHYHAATVALRLDAAEAMAYRVNLANGVPCVYVVMGEDGGLSKLRRSAVRHVTASPFEVQAIGAHGAETVERVPMPAPLIELVKTMIGSDGPGELSMPPNGGSRGWGTDVSGSSTAGA